MPVALSGPRPEARVQALTHPNLRSRINGNPQLGDNGVKRLVGKLIEMGRDINGADDAGKLRLVHLSYALADRQ